jgi:TolB-like protein/Flp pilus assembly protein TadD
VSRLHEEFIAMNEFLARLKQHKLVQWAIAYVAAAFALLQGIDIVAQQFGWPEGVRRGITLGLVVGFFVTLVLAWYHGERGAQRVTGTELLIIGLVLTLGGGLLWRFAAARSADNKTATVPNESRMTEPAAAISEKSIAVLPFENLSEDTGNAYFAAGIQDEILTRLANLRELKVISRTSTAKYQSHPDNLKAIAAELGVATILEGAVQKLGNTVHINVQLINAADEAHIWAQSYDRNFEHAFAVEGEVAQTVADALKVAQVPAQIEKLKSPLTENAQAYDLFLRGEYEFNRAWMEADELSDTITKAGDYFREATKIDPQFSLAYASVARAEVSEYHFRLDSSRGERRTDLADEAKRNIDHSLALTPDLATAHLALGEWYCWITYEYPGAIEELQRAINLDPHLTEATIRLAGVELQQGHPEQAIEQLRYALRTDPRNVVIHRWIGTALRMQRKYAASVQSYTRALAIDPNDLADILNLAWSFRSLGDFDAAAQVLETYPPAERSETAFVNQKLTLLARKHDYHAMEEVVKNTPPSAFSSEWSCLTTLGVIARGLERVDAAREHFAQARSAVLAAIPAKPDDPSTHADLAWLDATLNYPDEAVTEAQRAVKLSKKKPFGEESDLLVALAAVYAKLGRADDAITVLNQLSATPSGFAISASDLKRDPDWDRIRSDPRFDQMVASLAPKDN